MAGGWRRVRREMSPLRLGWRVLFGLSHPFPSKARVKRKVQGRRTYRMADEPNLSDGQRLLPPSQRKGAAPRKAPTKKQSSYEAAKAIPARNQAAAKKAAAARTTGAKKQVAKRKGNGQFDGSVTLPGADLTAYRRAVAGQVDPAQQVRSMRWPR